MTSLVRLLRSVVPQNSNRNGVVELAAAAPLPDPPQPISPRAEDPASAAMPVLKNARRLSIVCTDCMRYLPVVSLCAHGLHNESTANRLYCSMAISSHFIIFASLLMISWMWSQDDKTALHQRQALSQFIELCFWLRNPWASTTTATTRKSTRTGER